MICKSLAIRIAIESLRFRTRRSESHEWVSSNLLLVSAVQGPKPD